MARADVSACLIVRDAEASLPRAVQSVADLVGEVVVVDTGSRDGTRARAEALGCRVSVFPWSDDFAAARNESLRLARGRWVFWLDADEYLDEPDRRKLRDLLAGLPADRAAYALTQRSVLPNGAPLDLESVRLFRNHPDIRWQYRVHEQIAPAILLLGHVIHATDLVVQHAGYHDAETYRRKLERNARLLELDLRERPDDAFLLLNLGTARADLGRPDEAVGLLRRSVREASPSYSTGRSAYAALVQCHLRLGQLDEAWAVCAEGRRRYPGDVALRFWEGLLLRDRGDLAGAERCLRELVQSGQDASFGALDMGLKRFVAPHALGQVYLAQGRGADAERQWREVVAAYPFHEPSWKALAELYLAGRRWDDLDAVIGRLEARDDWAAGAAVLRARRHLARQEFGPARALLERLIAQAPDALAPRYYLTHVLMAEGKDWPAAERALREVLRLDPRQAHAWHNLAVVLRRQGRHADAAAACATGLRHCPGDPHLTQLHAALQGGR